MMGTLFQGESMIRTLTNGKCNVKLCRARTSDYTGLYKHEMGPPPATRAVAGRVNASGIRCLYLTNNTETALHEIRAQDFEYVTIGTFTPIADLKLVDLTVLDMISPFTDSSFDFNWFAINIPILKKISTEIAKPLSRQDSELDYLPTQYISDFIRSQGFDGLCYKSTLCDGGINYAVFNYEKLECKSVELIQVSSLEYCFDRIN